MNHDLFNLSWSFILEITQLKILYSSDRNKQSTKRDYWGSKTRTGWCQAHTPKPQSWGQILVPRGRNRGEPKSKHLINGKGIFNSTRTLCRGPSGLGHYFQMLKAQGQTDQAFHSWSGEDRRGSKGTQVCFLYPLTSATSTSLRWENLLQEGLQHKGPTKK